MSTEKRTVLAITLCLAWILGANYMMNKMGWAPKPAPAAPAPEVVEGPEVDPNDPAKAKELPDLLPAPKVDLVPAAELALGSTDPKTGYHLMVRFDQRGAGVSQIDLSGHESERTFGRKAAGPLRLLSDDVSLPDSFVLNIDSFEEGQARGKPLPHGKPLELRDWEVVRDAKGRVVSPLDEPKEKGGQQVVFRTQVGDPAVTLTKTFRLRPGADALEMILEFDSPTADRKLAYILQGPHGLPIEGEWYTSTFREVIIGSTQEGKATPLIESRLAADVVKKAANPEKFLTLPIKFAGVENQYFAVFFEPVPDPALPAGRVDEFTIPVVVSENVKEKPKSDVSVAMTSRTIDVGPNRPASQMFQIFAGPKVAGLLAPFGAQELATYRKSGWFAIPFAPALASNVISPLLNRIYALTESVARLLGFQRGNYGIAIILLTITVRLMLFPLSRRQALQAKKMQEIQPLLTALKEKYKDDKERQMREHFALMKRHNVKMSTGCLLGLIQLPIFVGLWQALNNSVALRNASFLWINNLAAPDMMFRFPADLPILGHYFNLLPFAVMALMILQMHLFTPPASTPEQEQTQKIMKPMMAVMALMFYKVPAGLGIYFITSSSWAICERLLLPKITKAQPIAPEPDLDESINGSDNSKTSGKPKPIANGSGEKPAVGRWGRLMEQLEQIRAEAEKKSTVRNTPEKDKDRNWDKEGRSRPNRPPGRKR